MGAAHDPPPSRRRLLLAAFGVLLMLASLASFRVQGVGGTLVDLDASAPSQKAGERETWTFSFLAPQTGTVAGYKVKIWFPQGSDVSGAGVSCAIDDAVVSTSVDAGALGVFCTITDGSWLPNEYVIVHVSNAKNPDREADHVDFTLRFEAPTGTRIADGTAFVDIHPNDLLDVSFTLLDDRAGEETDLLVHFKTKNPTGGNGDVRLLLPDGFAVASDATCSIAGLGSLPLTWVTGTEAKCVLQGVHLDADAAYDLTLTKISLPHYSTDFSGARVETRSQALVHDALDALIHVEAHPFNSGSMTADQWSRGSTTDFTFTFALANPWPADGCFRTEFPDGFEFDEESGYAILSGADGTFGPATIEGGRVQACRASGNTTDPGATVDVVLSMVTLPGTMDPVDVLMQTLTPALELIDYKGLKHLVDCVLDCPEPPRPPPGSPDEPELLRASQGTAHGTLSLSWMEPLSDGGKNITNYKVYRAESAGGPYELVATLPQVLAYLDAGLGDGVKRYYRVTAVNEVSEGNRSNIAVAETWKGPGSGNPTPPTDRTGGQPEPSRVDPITPGPGFEWPNPFRSRMDDGAIPTAIGLFLVTIVLTSAATAGWSAWKRRRFHVRVTRKPPGKL